MDPRTQVVPARTTPPDAAGFDLSEVYYTLFRHKWKILFCIVAGVAGALVMYLQYKPMFQSEAKLFVRYVITEAKTARTSTLDDTTIKSPDMRGETIMIAEQQILNSMDLARKVAEAMGPEKILPKAAPVKDINAATIAIRDGLRAEVPRGSSVLNITFRHRDPSLVQPILREIVDQYLKMHVEVHRAAGLVGDFLSQETDQLRSRLTQTEDELRKANKTAGVVSIDDAKLSLIRQMSSLRELLFNLQAEYAERTSVLQELAKSRATQAASAAGGSTAEQSSPTPVMETPATKVDEYRIALGRIESLRRREQDLLVQFTAENPRVVEVKDQLVAAEAARDQLTRDFPTLLQAGRSIPTTAVPMPISERPLPTNALDITLESARIQALQSKIKALNAQMEMLRNDAAALDQMEGTITELRRRKDLEEANYRRYAASLEQSRIDGALGAGKISNISQIQSPSPASMDAAKPFKQVGGVAGAGIAAGLAWAFAIEMLFDRSVRRAGKFERMFKIPLFISIPIISARKRGLFSRKKSVALVTENGARENFPIQAGLRPFFETLRDRLIGYFERRDLTHKPKLVAVTGLGNSSGVTTVAAGLAESLSSTGEGNVLLVDMTTSQGAAQQFIKGQAVCALDALLDSRENAQVQENLYVVNGSDQSERLTRSLPQRFSKLIPKLKASDFDYIIFDMPSVSQISITPRLAAFMDVVLLVVEAEKTDRELVQRATSLLEDSNAHVGAVLTKTRSYVPTWLHQEFLHCG
jgi:polysaccharide biosynthesis transport protein